MCILQIHGAFVRIANRNYQCVKKKHVIFFYKKK